MSGFDRSFWDPTPIAPIPTLARLREMVLERSEQRSPKWKFRIAPDLVLQIQAKLTTALLRFEGLALLSEGADLEMLLKPRSDIDRDYWRIKFDLRAVVQDQWLFKPTACGWKYRAEQSIHQRRRVAVDLRARVVTALSTRFDKLQSDMLLGSHCLCCGKGLTDPVSQARFIGPECAGTASANLPFIIKSEILNSERPDETAIRSGQEAR
jgi:hypothetical protein